LHDAQEFATHRMKPTDKAIFGMVSEHRAATQVNPVVATKESDQR
jgi:hypothetical protein